MTSRIHVILITGKKGSGKDTFGRFLTEELNAGGYAWEIASFAKPLKEMVSMMLGVPQSICGGDLAVKEGYQVYGHSVRHWLQWFGTEVFRQGVHQDYWVHQMLRRIVGSRDNRDAWVITDCRFPNEWLLLRDVLEWQASHETTPKAVIDALPTDCLPNDQQWFQCHLVKVTRPGFEDRGDKHASETSVDLLDQYEPKLIVNDKTIEDLRVAAHDYVENLR